MTDKWRRGLASICIVSYLLTSCTTLHEVRVPEAATSQGQGTVEVGDTVVIDTKAGVTKTFKVTAVEPDALVGKHVRIAYADMDGLSVKRVSAERVLGIVLAVTIVVVLVAKNKAAHSIVDAVMGN